MSSNTDFELVKKYLDGDERAFNEIVRKYSEKIYWHARRMLGNHLDADEITQEVIIVLYKKLKTFNFNSSLYTWIYRITSNLCINYINKNKCVFVKYISSSTSWGGAMLQDEALEKVISDITHQANDAGANTILIKKLDKSFMGSTASGDAYRCNSIDSKTTEQLK